MGVAEAILAVGIVICLTVLVALDKIEGEEALFYGFIGLLVFFGFLSGGSS